MQILLLSIKIRLAILIKIRHRRYLFSTRIQVSAICEVTLINNLMTIFNRQSFCESEELLRKPINLSTMFLLNMGINRSQKSQKL